MWKKNKTRDRNFPLAFSPAACLSYRCRGPLVLILCAPTGPKARSLCATDIGGLEPLFLLELEIVTQTSLCASSRPRNHQNFTALGSGARRAGCAPRVRCPRVLAPRQGASVTARLTLPPECPSNFGHTDRTEATTAGKEPRIHAF